MPQPSGGIVTVIQARTGSTRLPYKVLRPLAGKPLLIRMAERVLAAKRVGTVVVATTTESADDPLERMGSHSNRIAIQLITCWSHLCGRGAQVGTGRRLVCPLSILCAQVRLRRGYRLH